MDLIESFLMSLSSKLFNKHSRSPLYQHESNFSRHTSTGDLESDSNGSRIFLAGNTNYFQNNVNDYDVAEYNLDSVSELCIDTFGAAYILPSGVKIVIPKGISCNKDKIHYKVSKEPTKFMLNLTDQLLSPVVELTPNGLTFSKSLQLSIPYHYTACDKQTREIVMRVTTVSPNGFLKYEDLNSELINNVEEDADNFSGEVVSFASYLSIFGVISRLKEDYVVVKNEQPADVFSSVNPFTRLHFPKSSVVNPINVSITVLAIDNADVMNIAKSDHCPVSNVLQVTVSPKKTLFQTPVAVYLALPNSLIGQSYDKDMLRLLKSSDESEDWQDITTEVDLIYTTESVSFQVDSFSKFWLVWKKLKFGDLKKVIRRTTTYEVQFLAMQQEKEPSLVVAQCVPVKKVKKQIKKLRKDGYCGKDVCSNVHNFMDGESFKVKATGGIQVKSNDEVEKRHLEKIALVKKFSCQQSSGKSGSCKFFIEPSKSNPASKAKGYISFYKVLETECDVPESNKNYENGNAPAEKDLSKGFLDHVPITLDCFEAAVELPEAEDGSKFGVLQTDIFNEIKLSDIASKIGMEWYQLAHRLGIIQAEIDRITQDHHGNMLQQIFAMLLMWSQTNRDDPERVIKFVNALKEVGRTDIAEEVEKMTKKE